MQMRTVLIAISRCSQYQIAVSSLAICFFQLLPTFLSLYRSTFIYLNILLTSSFAETQNSNCHGRSLPATGVLVCFSVIQDTVHHKENFSNCRKQQLYSRSVPSERIQENTTVSIYKYSFHYIEKQKLRYLLHDSTICYNHTPEEWSFLILSYLDHGLPLRSIWAIK